MTKFGPGGTSREWAVRSPCVGKVARMDSEALDALYRDYIACLNARDWGSLATFVDERVLHNGRTPGLAGYRAMLEQNVRDIPDLHFAIELLVVDPPQVASRLRFDCTPAADFLGLPVAGRRVTFREHAFYAFADGRIARVWSVLDKAAIEAQL